jgi:hypothetical protein
MLKNIKYPVNILLLEVLLEVGQFMNSSAFMASFMD